MPSPDQESFRQVWPRCFVIFLGIIELLCVAVFILTELGNVGSNFWTTNVFAGAWCGLVMFIHFFALFAAGCCCVGPPAATRAVVITIVALLACAALISFDAVFIAQPSTCILTPSCASNAASTTLWSYNIQSAFFTAFTSLSPFKSYTQTQAKFLFQTIQLGVGCLCFVLCIIYLIIYYVSKSKASKRVSPGYQQNYPAPQPAYQQQQQYQSQGGGYRQPPRQPQLPPGDVPWAGNRRY